MGDTNTWTTLCGATTLCKADWFWPFRLPSVRPPLSSPVHLSSSTSFPLPLIETRAPTQANTLQTCTMINAYGNRNCNHIQCQPPQRDCPSPSPLLSLLLCSSRLLSSTMMQSKNAQNPQNLSHHHFSLNIYFVFPSSFTLSLIPSPPLTLRV